MEFRAWVQAKSRCYDRNRRDYKNYGGRGIKMCARWKKSFVAFLKDMGNRPSSTHSLDRRDNNGNYEPGNCRWATRKQQAQNRRSWDQSMVSRHRGTGHYMAKLTELIVMKIRASRMPITYWSNKLGMNASTIYEARIGKTWAHI